MEKPLKDKHSELIHRLYKPLIFYLPRKIWADVDDKFLNKEFDTVFNTVILMRENGDNHALNNSASAFCILGKAASLDKNIYDLLDLKVKLTSEAFQFLSEKYSLSVAFYNHVSHWMLEHVKDDILDCSEETINSFEIQKVAFAKHWDYIQMHFSVPDHINNYFDSIQLTTENISKIPDFITGGRVQKERIFENLVKPKINKKKVLITPQEAETFLLKTVFNVQL